VRVLLTNDLPLTADGGGAEVYLRRLVAGLRAAGDEVRVVAPPRPHRGAARALDLWDPVARRRLGAAAAAFRPDVVHHHNVFRELSVSVFGVPAGVPCLLTLHDLRLLPTPDPSLSGARRAVDRLVKRPLDLRSARRAVDTVLVAATAVADRLCSLGFHRVRQVPVPVDEPLVPPRPLDDCQDIAFAGRLSADKGLPVLLAAFDRLAGAHPGARLLLAGDGPLRGRLPVAGGRVRLLGRLDAAGMSRLLGSVRAVAVPTLPAVLPHGSSLVAAEAAMHGRPVVCSDDPGTREVVDRLGHGLVVPAGDPAALAAALDRLLDSAAEAARLGDSGRAAVAAVHGVPAVAAATRSAYLELAGG
jgi:glycosyltransferase involved in cell wall biosynthesis